MKCEACHEHFVTLGSETICGPCRLNMEFWRARDATEPPLKLNERFKIGRQTSGDIYARFNGEVIVLENENGAWLMHLSCNMVALLFWLNRRITDDFPEQWFVDLSEIDDD